MNTTAHSLLHAAILLVLVAACTAPPTARTPIAPSTPSLSGAWTNTFAEPALLIAEEVHIEGPRGLLDHFAVRIEEHYHERSEKTTPAGYLQRFDVRSDGVQAEIRAWLDELEIVALRSLTALERPGDVGVIVMARGDAFWKRTGDGRERRAERLRLVGEMER